MANVKHISFDLQTGEGKIWFTSPDKKVEAGRLWKAIKDAGFTPVSVRVGDVEYKGSKPQQGD